jgi:cytochrome c peroxidase
MMNKKSLSILGICLVVFFLAVSLVTVMAQGDLTPEEQLGKSLFFDKISEPDSMSCAECHAPQVGFTGPIPGINKFGAVYRGAVPQRFGNRKPPTAAYAGDSPVLYYDEGEDVWVGGMFWDGRATGWTLGDPLAEQAQGPFLNPLEQNNYSAQAVIDKVLASSYADLFLQVCTDTDTALLYDCIGRAIAAYERSLEVSQFTSKYDYWLKDEANLTSQEQWGLELFNGKGKCGNCHVEPLFTDFTYDNLGVPRNPLNPFYNEPEWNPEGYDWVDVGLGGFLEAAGYDPLVYEAEWGKQKVPTLRNVDKRPAPAFPKAFGHNGYFKSLEGIVHFYNTRDAKPECDNPFTTEKDALKQNCWPAPEVAANVNKEELGELGLTPDEEAAIVAFLKTLSDGYKP